MDGDVYPFSYRSNIVRIVGDKRNLNAWDC